MFGSVLRLSFSLALFAGVAGFHAAAAQDARQNTPGAFDFYVLALSWSPSFCAASGERAPKQQCGARPYSFVVHGLWPQYEKGYPEFCQVPAPRLNRHIVASMLDLMPAPRLIFNEWDKHGTCSGLSPDAYFETVRKARAVVKIPPLYLDPQTPLTLAPDEVEEAFVAVNPGLPRDGIAVQCDRTRLREVRVCLTKALGFRSCPEIDRRACRRERISLPPVRGGGERPRIEAPEGESPKAERAPAP
ncbi:MAG TPA: ribonuclease T2 [Xanthobacteraceae bacterium]|nr:ribonuclease T2 [Xanthobacteraceae bacterium]